MKLSQGTYYKSVPKGLAENLKYRQAVLTAARDDKKIQRGLMEMCKNDVVFWINTFAWQYNPNVPNMRKAPFITWDCQERFLLDRPETTGRKGVIWCYENPCTSVTEKSREMGASWLFLLLQVWLARFTDDFESLNISRSADAVDHKSMKSLFAKIRMINEHMPDWMLGRVDDNIMFIRYIESNGVITGEASTSLAGSGGRAAVVFVDEFSKIKQDTAVRQGTASTADCRFFNGTHLGVGTEFYKLCTSPEIVKLRLHWVEHPLKNRGLYSYDTTAKKLRFWKYVPQTGTVAELKAPNYDFGPDFNFVMDGTPIGGPFPGIRSPWYDQKAVSIGDSRGVAMELDIDAGGSVEQVFDPIKIRELKARWCTPPCWEGDLVVSADGKIESWKGETGGPFRLWVQPGLGMRVPRAPYGIGGDVSGGTGRTPSVLSITNAISGMKVAEYVNPRIDPKTFATLAVAICRWFCDTDGTGAMLAWEHRGPGTTFGHRVYRMDELAYRNVYRPKDKDLVGVVVRASIGWNPSQKRPMLLEYRSALYNYEMINPSERALDEVLMFKYDDRGDIVHSYEESAVGSAARENHSDIAIADGLSWKVVKDWGRLAVQAQKAQAEVQDDWIDPRTFGGRMKLWEMEREQAASSGWEKD